MEEKVQKSQKKEPKNRVEAVGVYKMKPTVKLTMTAVFTALMVVVNAFLTVTLTESLQVSVMIALSFYAGIFLGMPLGFACGFLGDLLGWLLASKFPYNPFINLSAALFCFLPAMSFWVVRKLRIKKKRYVSFLFTSVIVCFICYLICTVLLTSLGLWVYSAGTRNSYNSFIAWIVYRAGITLPNTLINLVLINLLYFPLSKIKYFKHIL